MNHSPLKIYIAFGWKEGRGEILDQENSWNSFVWNFSSMFWITMPFTLAKSEIIWKPNYRSIIDYHRFWITIFIHATAKLEVIWNQIIIQLLSSTVFCHHSFLVNLLSFSYTYDILYFIYGSNYFFLLCYRFHYIHVKLSKPLNYSSKKLLLLLGTLQSKIVCASSYLLFISFNVFLYFSIFFFNYLNFEFFLKFYF